MEKYQVTKCFISGILKGLTITETTSIKYNIGYTCLNPIGSSGYTITKCKEVI